MNLQTFVSGTVARRRANGYLGMNVAMSILAGEPCLVIEGERAVWRFTANLHLPNSGFVATVGTVEVDALTGKPLLLSPEKIKIMQERADAIAMR